MEFLYSFELCFVPAPESNRGKAVAGFSLYLSFLILNYSDMKNELLSKVIERVVYDVPPLFRAILEECCENVEKSDIEENSRVSMVFVSFYTTLPVLKGTIDAGLHLADSINLDYRNQVFVISKQSQIYQQLEEMLSKPLV